MASSPFLACWLRRSRASTSSKALRAPVERVPARAAAFAIASSAWMAPTGSRPSAREAHVAHSEVAARKQVEGERSGLELGPAQLERDLRRGCSPRRRTPPSAARRRSASARQRGGRSRVSCPCVGMTAWIRSHSSTLRMPSRITGVTGVSIVMQDAVGQLPLAELELRPRARGRGRRASPRPWPRARVRRSSSLMTAARRGSSRAAGPSASCTSERVEELLLGDEPQADQELAERLAGVVRPGRVHVAVAQDQPLLHRAALDRAGCPSCGRRRSTAGRRAAASCAGRP